MFCFPFPQHIFYRVKSDVEIASLFFFFNQTILMVAVRLVALPFTLIFIQCCSFIHESDIFKKRNVLPSFSIRSIFPRELHARVFVRNGRLFVYYLYNILHTNT